MRTKKITVEGRTFDVRELRAVELDDLDWTDKKLVLKQQILLSTGISEQDFLDLTLRERLAIVNTINELNGLGDFQKNLQTEVNSSTTN